MLLITEQLEDVEILTEGAGPEKSWFLEGVFLQGGIKNKNGRLYPIHILQKEVARYTEEYINRNRAYGELGHPATPTINLDRVSHMIKSLHQEGNNFIGRAKIITANPMGNIVRNLLAEGAKLAVSSRGMGNLREVRGYSEVQDDFYLSTAADIVADPSAPAAFVNGVMENCEWINVGGSWMEASAAKARKSIDRAAGTAKGLTQEAQLAIFETFLRSVKN